MASEVDICNLALGHLGDTATVASLDPPEGSAQAEHCARFYPIARDTLLEMHSWNFNTKRAQLAQLGSGWPEWDYAYAPPADAITILAVMPPSSTDDYTDFSTVVNYNGAEYNRTVGYVPQPYSYEVNESGAKVIYTDQETAVARYTARITDTTKFSPLFVNVLSWYLASMLAGPILKGDVGAAEAKRCLQVAFGPDGRSGMFGRAAAVDSNQRRNPPEHVVSWIAGR